MTCMSGRNEQSWNEKIIPIRSRTLIFCILNFYPFSPILSWVRIAKQCAKWRDEFPTCKSPAHAKCALWTYESSGTAHWRSSTAEQIVHWDLHQFPERVWEMLNAHNHCTLYISNLEFFQMKYFLHFPCSSTQIWAVFFFNRPDLITRCINLNDSLDLGFSFFWTTPPPRHISVSSIPHLAIQSIRQNVNRWRQVETTCLNFPNNDYGAATKPFRRIFQHLFISCALIFNKFDQSPLRNHRFMKIWVNLSQLGPNGSHFVILIVIS